MQTLPAAAGGAVRPHGSTFSPWVGVPARHPDLPWLRLDRDHCPRPFPQLARGARIRPKLSEGNGSRQGNYNQEQVKGRRSAEETTQHGSSFFFLAGMPHLKQLSPSMTSPSASSLLANSNTLQKLKACLRRIPQLRGTARDKRGQHGRTAHVATLLATTCVRVCVYVHKISTAPVCVCRGEAL